MNPLPDRIGASWAGRGAVVAGALCLALAVGLVPAALPAKANRFGPPYQALVMVDQATVFTQPDAGSPPALTVPRGTVVGVFDEVGGADETAWAKIPDGFIRRSDLMEYADPWDAEVVVDQLDLHADADARSPVVRQAAKGDILRVAGPASGVGGDTGEWWATTEGFATVGTLQQTQDEWAQYWAMPKPEEATQGWWGRANAGGNVHLGGSPDAPIVGQLAVGDRVKVLEEAEGQNVHGSATWYRIDGGRFAGAWIHSSQVTRLPDPGVDTTPPAGGATDLWIVINKTASTLTLVQDGQPRFATYVTLGKVGTATPAGVYSIIAKYRADDMRSDKAPGADHPYFYPNVPFTQYFRDDGSAIHGNYWHDHFGIATSQGCVNLTITDAAYLFNQTPQGTPVVVRD